MRPTARTGHPQPVFLQSLGKWTAAVFVLQHPGYALEFSVGEQPELGLTHLQLKLGQRQPADLVEDSFQHLDL